LGRAIIRIMKTKKFLPTLVLLASSDVLLGCVHNIGMAGAATPAVVLNGKGVTAYAAGDIAQCRNVLPQASGAAKTAALILNGIAQDKDTVVLSVGDNTYPVGAAEEFADCYQPTWGQFKARTHPSPGNHEYYKDKNGSPYFAYFGAQAGPGKHGYYSFEAGAWHIVSLNSNLSPLGLQEQTAWLKDDLAKHPARCTLAYWHHPLFSSGGHGNNERMRSAWDALQAAHADVILNGHDHDYERFAPQNGDGVRDDAHGMREFVVGTGGAALTPFAVLKENSEVGNNTTFGVLKLTLKDNGYEWQFLPVAGASFTDRGATLCHGAQGVQGIQRVR
jgi:3',5'-cyclic AMP phosphodiesterase CpdA